MHHKSSTDFTVNRAQASHLNIYEVLNSMDRADSITHPTSREVGRMAHQGMLICRDWDLFWIHWTKGSTKQILNNQQAVLLLDNKICELNPTYISTLLWLWQSLRKDRLLFLFHHIKWVPLHVHTSSCFHSCSTAAFTLLLLHVSDCWTPKISSWSQQETVAGCSELWKQVIPFSP